MTTPDHGWQPMDAIDRSWSGVGYVRSFLDLDMPSFDRMRAGLASLIAVSPEVGRWFSAAPPRWGVLRDADREAWLDAAVVRVDEPAPDAQRTFDLQRDPLGDHPFRVLVGPDWISIRMTHAMGDGYTVNALVGHLLDRGHADTPLDLPWTTISARRRDRLILREVAGHLGTLAWALRHRAELAGGSYEPASLNADAMSDLSVVAVSRAGFPRELRELRDRWFPGASAAAVAKVAFRGAFASTLPEPRPGFECLFNGRPADRATCWGNWSAGVFIHPQDDYSPLATTAEMVRVRDTGLPGLAFASLRLRGRGASGDSVQVAAREGAPRLTMSYTQEHAMNSVIPGLRAGRSRIGTQTRPNGVDTITVQAVELAGRLSVGLSFYPDVWARADVETALDRLLTDPASCLARALPASATVR